MTGLKALSVTPELHPLVKTGGLADVAGALPKALERCGVEMRSLLPAYPAVLRQLVDAQPVHRFADLFGGPARLLAGSAPGGAPVLAIDAPHLYAREGNPYLGPDGKDWPDNAERFAALGWVAARIGQGLLAGWIPDIVHAHDWQAALAPAYLALPGQPRPATVITIHNLAYQGRFPPSLLQTLRLPVSAYAVEGVEYYGTIGFLKAGLYYADRITTVSPTYAREIQHPALGMGLDGLLRSRADRLTGIVNGIDDQQWNPATDVHLWERYNQTRLHLRAVNKRQLQERFGLTPDPSALLLCVISRLVWQKGIDLILPVLPRLAPLGAQLAVLGSGDAELELSLADAASAHPGGVACVFGHDEALAHRLLGGADALLVPSRFEPCGLTQLYGLRYGAVPIVARVGGLADTVIEANEAALLDRVATGFQFSPVEPAALEDALTRAAALFRDQAQWRMLQRRGMTRRLGWDRAAEHYAELYRQSVGQKHAAAEPPVRNPSAERLRRPSAEALRG